VGLLIIAVCLVAVVHSCRRNQPTLVDANRPPETELWYVPADSTEYEYLVHMYWRGVDPDGVAKRFIWAILDTIVEPPLGWNPSLRVSDLRMGRFTTRTDSVFAFTAFRNEEGVGLRKNRQAFYVAAIDDNGVMDPEPAAVEFVATVGKLPEVSFTTSITRIGKGTQTVTTKHYNPAALDTVGMFRPLSISYSGRTTNGRIREFKFFPLTTGVTMAGANVWTTDLSDTVRFLPNVAPNALPSGRFRLAAQVKDDAGAESAVDGLQYTTGVCQVVVNFEPDTEIFKVLNTYFVGGATRVDSVDFRDSQPDTVPFRSWLTLFYRGWDNPYDSSTCQDVANQCIRYQVQYTHTLDSEGGPAEGGARIVSTERWLPEDGSDNNPFGTADSTSLTIGSETYDVRVRSLDEYLKSDGLPAEVSVTGSFSPWLTSFGLENYDGTVVADGDTLVWDWWNPANVDDTLDIRDPADPDDDMVTKEFFFTIRGRGRDNAKEHAGSGVKSWLYVFRRTANPSVIERLKTSGVWADATTLNQLNDQIRLVQSYSPVTDPGGLNRFQTLPGYLNVEYDVTLRGRDASLTEVFHQYMFLDGVKVLLNSYNAGTLSRWTGVMETRFYFAMRK
jgi:hypothetical protein